MTVFYDNMVATAARLLSKFGQTVTITYSTSETYTIATQTNAKITSTFTGKAVVNQFDTSEVDNESILATDMRMILEQTSRAPEVDNTVTVGSVVYRLLNVTTISPGGTDIVYICQLRI